MSIADRLASAQGKRDERPNIELAEEIAAGEDRAAIEVLMQLLQEPEAKKQQSDCIKVLYEVGERKPWLIDGHLKEFLLFSRHENNRLQWGAMSAIAEIARSQPEQVFENLPEILDAAEKGSVITRDAALQILVELAGSAKLKGRVTPHLLYFIDHSPSKQVPLYAERMQPVIPPEAHDDLKRAIENRLPDMEKESGRKRLQKLIRKLESAES